MAVESDQSIWQTAVEWAWAPVSALLIAVWTLLTGRISRGERAIEKLGERMDQQLAAFMARIDELDEDSHHGRQEASKAVQQSIAVQAATNLEVARQLGELSGQVAAHSPRR